MAIPLFVGIDGVKGDGMVMATSVGVWIAVVPVLGCGFC